MLNQLLTIFAPHHCYGCLKIGTLLCDNCKYDITMEPFSQCLSCLRPAGERGVCGQCEGAYSRAWCAGERHDSLEGLIDAYKWGNCLDAATVLGGVLGECLPELPAETHFVPIPTIAAHRRRRGYDHTNLMVRAVVKQRGGHPTPLLIRQTNSVQIGKSRAERLQQAKKAFALDRRYVIEPDAPYVIVDDVYTTGATINAAAQLLREAGARNVWVAVAARQPLD